MTILSSSLTTRLLRVALCGGVSLLMLMGCKGVSTDSQGGSISSLERTSEPNTLRVTGAATYFKKTKAAAFKLEECKDRCRLSPGDVIRYEGELKFEDDHLQLTLADKSIGCCEFQSGYLFGSQYGALVNGSSNSSGSSGSYYSTKTDANGRMTFGNYSLVYDAALGDRLAASTSGVYGRAGKCAGTNFNRGDCYECAANAMRDAYKHEMIAGRFDELNTGTKANSFAAYWNPARHESAFKLKRVWAAKLGELNGTNIANSAPRGSVIVWQNCGSSDPYSAGHISIVTKPGYACSSFCAEINNSCSHPRLAAVFVPFVE
jgi:hypothetical protein